MAWQSKLCIIWMLTLSSWGRHIPRHQGQTPPASHKQGRSQTLNLGWAREEHFLILSQSYFICSHFSSFSFSIWSSGREMPWLRHCAQVWCFLHLFLKHAPVVYVFFDTNVLHQTPWTPSTILLWHINHSQHPCVCKIRMNENCR